MAAVPALNKKRHNGAIGVTNADGDAFGCGSNLYMLIVLLWNGTSRANMYIYGVA